MLMIIWVFYYADPGGGREELKQQCYTLFEWCKGGSQSFQKRGQPRTHWLRRTLQRPDTTIKTGIKTIRGSRIHEFTNPL